MRDRGLPEATAARVGASKSGIAHLLVDEQFRTRADGHDDWFRWSGKITDRSGLEAAGSISLSYNPSFDNVAIAFIHIIRDRKVMDVTNSAQFRVVEREAELDDGIVSGAVTALANIPDVRVGDVVDYATITHTQNALWPGAAFFELSQRYTAPLALRAVRFVWPAGLQPRRALLNSDAAFAVHSSSDGAEWEWVANDPPVAQPESDVPHTAFQWGRIDISTMQDRSELARRTTAFYEGDVSLPADFTARLDSIAKTWPNPGDRLTEVTRYIEDNIRYVG